MDNLLASTQKRSASLASSLLLATMIPALTACSSEETNSAEVVSAKISTIMRVEAGDDNISRVVVELNEKDAFGANIRLVGNERLEVSAPGVTKVLVVDTDLFDIDYQARIEQTAGDTLFSFAFYRDAEPDALGSSVRLPQPFTILAPQDKQQFRVDEQVEMRWSAPLPGQNIHYNASINCTNLDGTNASDISTGDIDDNGAFSVDLPAITLFQSETLDRSKKCSLILTMNRENRGTLDPAFASNSIIQALQIRRVTEMDIFL